MKLAAVAGALLACGLARADAPGSPVDPGAVRLALRDTASIAYPGATAVFSVDPAIAEASIVAGTGAAPSRIAIAARAVGATTISVVTPTGAASFAVTVVAPPPRLAALAAPPPRAFTEWQAGYDSATERLTTSLEIVDNDGRRTLRGYAVDATRFDAAGDSTDARSSLPALAVEWRAGRYQVVAFDQRIAHSPLTLDGVTVRGGHVQAGGLELHAGVTSPLLYQDVFLPTQRETVLGASYELATAAGALSPAIYRYPGAPATGGTSGTVGSLLYRLATRDDRLHLAAELGWGGRLGAAGEVSYRDGIQRAWLSARHEPHGFAALGIGRPIGSTCDAVWSAEPTPELVLDASGSAARYELAEHHQDVAAASGEARVLLAPHLAVSGGASLGRFAGDAMATVDSVALPVGVHLDEPVFGASAIYRYQRNTERSTGGHGGRLAARVRGAGLHASGFVDVQEDAATLSLILRDEPALANLLTELGLTATSPEDLARLLRDNAALGQLGLVEGAGLEFHPWRAQAGGDLAWLAGDAAHQQVRLRALFDRTQAVSGRQDTAIASASYARRIVPAVPAIDATAAVSWWSHDPVAASTARWSVGLGVRVRFDDAPHLPSLRTRITGSVVIAGERDAPLPGVRVRLDGGRTMVSDSSGEFAFSSVVGGEHEVEAELPDGMYFTGPSQARVAAGGSVRFGVALAQAHLAGSVRDDQGAGVGGVTLALLGGARGEFRTTTDSSGRFQFAVASGGYTLAPVTESIPAGYDVAAAHSQAVELAAGEPSETELVVPAYRSIAGTVHAPPAALATATVVLIELDRSAVVDDDGRYVFRGLAPGHYTIEATVGELAHRREVDVPLGPAAIRDVDFP